MRGRAVTRLGPEAAVLLHFRRDIWTSICAWTLSPARPALRPNPAVLTWCFIIVGTLPIAMLGFALWLVSAHLGRGQAARHPAAPPGWSSRSPLSGSAPG